MKKILLKYYSSYIYNKDMYNFSFLNSKKKDINFN